LAGALALQAAGPAAARVRIGYFVQGNIRKATSAGTRASVAGVLLEPGYSFRSGRLVTERTAAHVASFEVDGSRRQAFSIGSSEHFALPRLQPLTDVGVYFGWFGAATGLVHYASALAAPLERLPGVRGALDRRGSVLVHRACPRLGRGQGGRARRAARRRARPGGSIRTRQPRKSLRRGWISSKPRPEGCLMDAGSLNPPTH
jgi:hypothetical protein